MKKAIFAIVVSALLAPLTVSAQKFHNDYYDTRRAAHNDEGIPEGSVVFVGNSITEQGWWNMLFKTHVVNRGIGGDNTFGMFDRLPDILASHPVKIFLMAGVNDITGGQSVDTIVGNIEKMADMVRDTAPECELYIQSVLPVSTKRVAYAYIKGHNPKIAELNVRLEELCKGRDRCTFVNIAPLLSDSDGELRKELTKDGIHIHPEAYVIWTNRIKKLKYLK